MSSAENRGDGKVVYRRGPLTGNLEIELDSDSWEAERNLLGISWENEGSVDYRGYGDLMEAARELEYDESESSGGRFMGGYLETPYGRRTWEGDIPEDVREFVNKIDEAVEGYNLRIS